MTYFPSDVAIVVPTRNRPENIYKFLEILSTHKNPPGLIVIVANGDRLDAIIEPSRKNLNILYLHTKVQGQVNQRNIGIDEAKGYALVACLDDDIELAQDSLGYLLTYWNQHSSKEMIAAIGFNIQNLPSSREATFKRKLLGIPETPGLILPCGIATAICAVDSDVRSQWVNGGATVWRRDILLQNRHRHAYPLPGKAYAEDVFFSYPLSQNYEFYIVAKAIVNHNDAYVSYYPGIASQFLEAYREGYRIARARLLFVRTNPTLSELRLWFFWIRNDTLKLVAGGFRLSPRFIGAALGSFQYLFQASGELLSFLRKQIVKQPKG